EASCAPFFQNPDLLDFFMRRFQRLEVRCTSSLACCFESGIASLTLSEGPRRFTGPLRAIFQKLRFGLFLYRLDSKYFARYALGVREHAGDLRGVGLAHQDDTAKLFLGLRFLGSEDVAHLRLTALELTARSLLEALGRAGVGLQLGHGCSCAETAR